MLAFKIKHASTCTAQMTSTRDAPTGENGGMTVQSRA